MRIVPNVVSTPIARDSRDAQPAKSGDAAPSTAASIVSLSAAGASASSETRPATGSTSTTTTRLQTIRAQLDKGNYPVDLDVLASRIVDDEFLRAGRS